MTTWTRRRFLAAAAGGAAASRASAFQPPDGSGSGQAGDIAAGLVARFRDDQRRSADRGFAPTGLSKAEYLRLVEGIARFFATYQDARGAIVDPYEARERQYSTPAFALSAGVLCAAGKGAGLLPAATRAMEASCADLADGRAADGHADFYTVLLLHADLVLRGLAPADAVRRWRDGLARLAPERVYRQQPTARSVSNWNLVAVAGEHLRTREGLGSSGAWVESSLDRQRGFFTASGQYRDPNDPMAYDHFARLWALDLVEEGYAGPHAAWLGQGLERAAWLSLFLQSPHGELPCGGRSAHHQWNEAQQAVTFETFARRFARRGDAAAAGAFKRGARLSVQSIARWVRPSGELWVVKNRVDPRLRHGYESYSFHSQYNLLTAAMLSLAWLRADDEVAERPGPADSGGYAFALQPEYHKVVAAAGGWYVEVDTGADLHYNPTGILRIHNRGLASETISDGVTPSCAYTVPSKPSRALAVGPEWSDGDGNWTALASHGAADLDQTTVRVVSRSIDRVEVELSYRGRLRGGATGVREVVRVSARGVEVEHAVEGGVRGVRQVVPVLVSDGLAETTVTAGAATAEVVRRGCRLRLAAGDGGAWSRAGVREACRNGFAEALDAGRQGRAARCVIDLAPRV